MDGKSGGAEVLWAQGGGDRRVLGHVRHRGQGTGE